MHPTQFTQKGAITHMARTPIQPIPLSAQLQPQAQPIDTYVKPPARNQLHDLADALGSVDQSLQNFLSIRDEKQQQDDYLRGQAAYYTDHEGEFAKAVTEGKIPAQYSPFYVNGFKNAQGQAMGDKLSQGWQQAWDTWDGKNTEDPQAFDTFFQSYLKQNLGTNDPQVLKGILPQVRQLHDKAYEQYTQYRHQATVDGNLTAHTAVIANTVQDGVDQGLASGDPKKGTDYTGIFGRVNDTIAKTLATGDPNGKAVDTFIDAMAAKIVATRDPKLLDWFQTKVPGKDYTFGSTPHGLEVVNQTVKHLETEARQAAAGISAAERQAMEKAKDEAQSGIIKGLIDNPNKAIDEKLLQQAEKNGDPLIRVHSVEWAKTLQQGYSDPKKVASFYDDVISGRTSPQQALREALGHGVFGSAEDMRAAASFVQNYKTYEDTIEKALGGRVATMITGSIKDRTLDKEPINPVTGLTNDGLAATSDFRQLVTRWIMANPNASQAEIDEQTNKFGKMILDQLSSAELYSSATYKRNPDLPFGNPYAPNQQGSGPNAPPPSNGVQGEGAQQPAATEGQGKPAANEVQPQDQQMEPSKDPTVRKWEEDNSLRPDQKTLIEKQAQQFGMTYDQFIHERALRDTAPANPPAKPADPNASKATDPNAGLLHKTAYNPNSKDHGEGDQSGSGMTPETAGQMLDQAFSPAVDITGQDNVGSLKALIKRHESKGNYNAVYGNADSQHDLSQYTVDEILGQQQYARTHGAKSTAIGAYMLLYKTLKGLKAQMGLSGNEKFTPELQEKMGDTLLLNRGLKDFQNGRMSKKAFALSLSQEWAALPDPNTGRSFYDGDGLNRALTSTAKVYEALGFAATPSVQNAAYTPSSASSPMATGWAPPNPNAYANIPEADNKGQGGQRSKFLEWNSDPVANNERNLSEIQPELADVVRKAQSYLPFKIVIGSGKRTAEQQQKAVDWGWSKTLDSDHLDGHAADIWVIDQNGAVVFDKKQQLEVAKAMKQAAGELGVGLDVGADWKRFKDLPHFALKRKGTTA